VSTPAAGVVKRAEIDVGDLDISDVMLHEMPWWMARVLGSGVGAVTLSDSIFVAPDVYEAVVDGERPTLLLHELVHVSQWRREGRLGFLTRYTTDYLRNRLIGLNHEVAYRAIGHEAAAYDASERPDREPL
jgi:hypothetical protein